MKNKLLIGIFTAVTLAAFLLGTTDVIKVAGTSAAADGESDRFIGVFVTTKNLASLLTDDDTLDYYDGLVTDTYHISLDSDYYSQVKLYAELKDDYYTVEETGEICSSKKYSFTAIRGYGMFSALVSTDGAPYRTSADDGSISVDNTIINTSDAGENLTLEGSLHVCDSIGHHIFWVNRVYQQPDGRVYAVQGQGVGVGSSPTEIKYEEKYTEGNGETFFKTVLTIDVVPEPQKITVMQLSSDNSILRKDEYAPNEVPETVIPDEGTEYLVIESQNSSAEPSSAVTRELCGKDREFFSVFAPLNDGVCEKKQISVEWEDDSDSEIPFDTDSPIPDDSDSVISDDFISEFSDELDSVISNALTDLY